MDNETQEKIKLINKLKDDIFEGELIDVNFNDDIADCCNKFENYFYENGTIDNSYEMPSLESLMSIATASKFGLGTETLYDDKVRNSFEILADKLDPVFVENISKNIVLNNLAPNYELKPYKLVIYKKGCFFKSHKDTIRDPKHIGTVSCILNSQYSGGEFCINHNDVRHSFDDTNIWIGLYGDVFHEVKEVYYGIRISLLFDIYLKDQDHDQKDQKEQKEQIREDKLINNINEKFNTKHYHNSSLDTYFGMESLIDKVVIILNHEYSKIQLNVNCLKQMDKTIYDILIKHFNVSIKHIMFYVEGYHDEIYEQHILDKTGLLKNAYVSCNNIEYNNSIYKHTAPYTGNDGQEEEGLYIHGCFVITKKI